MAGLHILADAMADERGLRGAVDQRHKLILVIFGKVFIFNLWQKKKEKYRLVKRHHWGG